MYFKIIFFIFIGVAHGGPIDIVKQDDLEFAYQKVCDERYNLRDLHEKERHFVTLRDKHAQVESDYKVFKASIKEYNEALQEKQEAGFAVNEIKDNIRRCYFFAKMCAMYIVENNPNKDVMCNDQYNQPLIL